MATKTINAVAVTNLGDSGVGNVTTKVIHLQSTSFVGSITVKGRKRGSAFTFVAIPYRKRYLNAAVGDETFVSTAITDTSLIEVNSDGIEIALDCTAYTSGTMAVDTDDLMG